MAGKNKITRYMRIYVGGYDLSGDARTFSSLDAIYDPVDFTGWSESVRNFLAGYKTEGVRGFQALMNDTTARSFDALKDTENEVAVTLAFGNGAAPAVGDPVYMIDGIQVSDMISLDSQAVVMTADFLVKA